MADYIPTTGFWHPKCFPAPRVKKLGDQISFEITQNKSDLDWKERCMSPQKGKVVIGQVTPSDHLVEDAKFSPEPTYRELLKAKAYELWCQRGCPDGAPQIDWYEAEKQPHESPGSKFQLPHLFVHTPDSQHRNL